MRQNVPLHIIATIARRRAHTILKDELEATIARLRGDFDQTILRVIHWWHTHILRLTASECSRDITPSKSGFSPNINLDGLNFKIDFLAILIDLINALLRIIDHFLDCEQYIALDRGDLVTTTPQLFNLSRDLIDEGLIIEINRHQFVLICVKELKLSS